MKEIKLLSWNVNGIRAVRGKGFLEWFYKESPDVLCLQETKAQPEQLSDDLLEPEGYHVYWNFPERKGYSGTALFSRQKPQKVQRGLGWDPCDSEGRLIQADFRGLSVISLYVPSGSSSDEALKKKLAFHKKILPYFPNQHHLYKFQSIQDHT